MDRERLEHLPEGPLKMARFALWWIRKTFFAKAKPPNPAVFVDLTEAEIVELLGTAHFEPAWEFSYSYRHEVINLRRVEYVADHPLDYRWWQVHVRGYEHADGRFELAAHFELEPTEYPSSHIKNVGLDVERGNAELMALLDDAGVPYEHLDPEAVDTRIDHPVPAARAIRPARWTPLTMIAPGRYVDRSSMWQDFPFREWSRTEYTWTQDDWNGIRDFASEPHETTELGEGDCEDYALVAASWALAQGHDGVGLGFCFEWPSPWPTHAIAFDAERVYSSGTVTETSVDEWLADARYDYVLRRPVS